MARPGFVRLLTAAALAVTLVGCSSEETSAPVSSQSVVAETTEFPESTDVAETAESTETAGGADTTSTVEKMTEPAMCAALSQGKDDEQAPIERFVGVVGKITAEGATVEDFPSSEELADIRDSFTGFAAQAPEPMSDYLTSVAGFTQELIEVRNGTRTAAQLSDDYRPAGYKLMEICTMY